MDNRPISKSEINEDSAIIAREDTIQRIFAHASLLREHGHSTSDVRRHLVESGVEEDVVSSVLGRMEPAGSARLQTAGAVLVPLGGMLVALSLMSPQVGYLWTGVGAGILAVGGFLFLGRR